MEHEGLMLWQQLSSQHVGYPKPYKSSLFCFGKVSYTSPLMNTPTAPWQVALQTLVTALQSTPVQNKDLSLLILLLQTLHEIGQGNALSEDRARRYIGDIQLQWTAVNSALLNDNHWRAYQAFVAEFNSAFPEPQSSCAFICSYAINTYLILDCFG